MVGEGKRRAWRGREVKIGIYKAERGFLKQDSKRDPSNNTMLSGKRMTGVGFVEMKISPSFDLGSIAYGLRSRESTSSPRYFPDIPLFPPSPASFSSTSIYTR